MQPTDLQRLQALSLSADGTQQMGPPAAKRSRGAGGAVVTDAGAGLAERRVSPPIDSGAAAAAARPAVSSSSSAAAAAAAAAASAASAARPAASSSSSAAAAAAASAARPAVSSSSSAAAAAAAAHAAVAVAVPAPAPAPPSPLSLYSLLSEPSVVSRRQKLIQAAVANLVQGNPYLAVSHSAAARAAAAACNQPAIKNEADRILHVLLAREWCDMNPIFGGLPLDIKFEILSYLSEEKRVSLYSELLPETARITTQEAKDQKVLTTRQLRERVVRPKNVFCFEQFKGDKSTEVWDYWDTHDKETFSFFSHDELGLSLYWVQVRHLDKIINFFKKYPDKAAKLKGLEFEYLTSAQSKLKLLAEGIHDRLLSLLNLFPNLERVELSMSTAAQFAKGDFLERAEWLGRVKDFTLSSDDVRMTADELRSFLIHMPNLEKLNLSDGSFAAYPTDLELPSLKEFTRLNERGRSSRSSHNLGLFVGRMRNLEKLHLNTTDPFLLPGDARFPQLRELIMPIPRLFLDRAPNLERLEILETHYIVDLSGDFVLNNLRKVILQSRMYLDRNLRGRENFEERHPRAKWTYRR